GISRSVAGNVASSLRQGIWTISFIALSVRFGQSSFKGRLRVRKLTQHRALPLTSILRMMCAIPAGAAGRGTAPGESIMLPLILQAFLAVALLAVGLSYVEKGSLLPEYRVYLIIGSLVLAGAVIAVDSSLPRKSLQALSGVFFGLMVGLLITFGLTFVLDV